MTDPNAKVWHYTYNNEGQQASMQAPLGETTSWVYDNVGRIESMTEPAGNATPTTPPSYTYTYVTNAFGQVTQTTDPDGHVSSATFDADGNQTSSTDANANTTSYGFDDADQATSTTRPGTSTTHTGYWPDGSLETQTDGAGNATTYNYNPLGELTSVVDPDARATSYSYDVDGNMTSDQSPGGNCATSPTVLCTTYSYSSESGYLAGITYSTNGGITTPAVTGLSYDDYGNRVTMTDGTGNSSWAWNTAGEMTSATDGATNTIGYTYDDRGLLTNLSYPGGNCSTPTKCVTRGYDDDGRWTSVTDWNGHTTNFGYDADSNEHTITYPTSTGNVDTFSFDQADQLSPITYAQGLTTTASFTYGRLDDGSLSSQTQTGMPGDTTDAYGYSSTDQLCWSNPSSVTSNVSDSRRVRRARRLVELRVRHGRQSDQARHRTDHGL